MSRHAGSIWIDNHFGNIPRDLWIAADATRMVAEDIRYDRLIAFLIAQNIPLRDLTIGFFPSGAIQ